MTLNLEAVYQNGVLRPLQSLPLEENQRVHVVVTPLTEHAALDALLDHEFMDACRLEADDSVSLEEVRRALAQIPGSMAADFAAEREER